MNKALRRIQLDDELPASKLGDGVVWERRELHNDGYTQRWRDSNNVLFTERITHYEKNIRDVIYRDTRRQLYIDDAIIDYSSIIAKAKIEADDDVPVPWKEYDGYAHSLESFDDFSSRIENTASNPDDVTYDELCRRFKASRGEFYSAGNGRRRIILEEDFTADFQHYHNRGASKQVAAECVAQRKRQLIDQLRDWFTNGYEAWCVTIHFRDCIESCGGIDSYSYAEKEVVPELAATIAWSLEKLGYVVINQPTRQERAASYRQNRIETMRRRACEQNW